MALPSLMELRSWEMVLVHPELASHPMQCEILHDVGTGLLEDGSLDRARKVLQDAYIKCPIERPRLRGRILMELTRALLLDGWFAMAVSFGHLWNIPGAEATHKAYILKYQSEGFHKLGRIPEAMRALRLATRITGIGVAQRAALENNLGFIYMKHGEFALALPHFKAAIPAEASAVYNLASCLYHMSKFDKARVVFLDITKRDPSDLMANYQLAKCYLGLADEAESREVLIDSLLEALQCLQHCKLIDPTDEEVCSDLMTVKGRLDVVLLE